MRPHTENLEVKTMTQERYIKIKQTQAGQEHRYGDSHFRFEIESDLCEELVERFCTEVLRPCHTTEDKWRENRKKADSDMGIYFGGFYTFQNKGNGLFEYYVYKPYCD